MIEVTGLSHQYVAGKGIFDVDFQIRTGQTLGFCGLLSLYVLIIIGMYGAKMMETLNSFNQVMPQLMSAVGMKNLDPTLLGFMVSYLYGFILVMFPMIFILIRSYSLVGKYIESGSLTIFLAAPIKRKVWIKTQIVVLSTLITLLMLYVTGLQVVMIQVNFPGQIEWSRLLLLNLGLWSLRLLIGAICFLSTLVFPEVKVGYGIGLSFIVLQFILQMLANTGPSVEFFKRMTFFSLFDLSGITTKGENSILLIILMFVLSKTLNVITVKIFEEKNLPI